MAQLKEEEGIMMFEFAEEIERLADIKVIGVGGAGGNAVNRMITAGLSGVEFLAVNTDLQALQESQAHNPMQIGAQLTKGLGSGGMPTTGHSAAEEDRETIGAALRGADMVFVAAGMGGGTGTGAAPVIAEIARSQGTLTVGIVTKPFAFEGRVRMQQAVEGIARLRDAVDTLIVIPNQRLLEVVPPSTSMQEAFRIADNVLYEATRGIYEIISRHDHVNLDFADVRSVMTGMGEAMMGTGRAAGENRAVEAARAAISSPLLENLDIAGSQAVLVNVVGREVELHDTAAAMQFVQDAAGPQAHVIFGYGIDETLEETLQITVIATGFRAAGSSSESRSETGWPARSDVAEPREAEAVAEAPAADLEPDADPTDDEWAAHPEEEEQIESTSMPAPAAELEGIEEDLFAATSDEDAAEVVEPMAAEAVQEPSGEPAPEPVRETGFLTRAACAGGADRIAETFDQPNPEPPEVDPVTDDPAPASRFLRPVGKRNIGEVEVPEAVAGPATLHRSVAAGLRPDSPGNDLSPPAYTRKYMD